LIVLRPPEKSESPLVCQSIFSLAGNFDLILSEASANQTARMRKLQEDLKPSIEEVLSGNFKSPPNETSLASLIISSL
jgi:hypothetical protein